MNRFVTLTAATMMALTIGLLGWNATARAQGKSAEKVVSIEGITEYKLANGVRILLLPDSASSTITVNMTVQVGSRQEGYGETGMAHLLEHMLFKGAKGFPFADKALEAHGAEANATTWVDRTHFYETMPATDANLDFGIRFEADRLLNAFIRHEDLVKEMIVVRNEFEQGENNPDNILNQRMMAVAYEWHNYGKSTIGNRSDIERYPIERLQGFYRKYYRPDNIVLIVAGKFDETMALDLINKNFGILKSPDVSIEETYTEEPPQDGERSVTLRRVGKGTIVSLMYHIPAVSHPDHAAIEVLSSVLGHTPSGRLYKALVETKKATKVSVDATGWHDPGVLELTVHVADQGSADDVRDIMIKEAEGFFNNRATKVEVDRAIQQYLSAREQSLSKSKHIALELSEWIGAGDWRLLFIHRDSVAKVTPADVDRVAAQYLKQSNRTSGLFLPTTAPTRTRIPPNPEIASLVKDYKGGQVQVEGEAFDPSPENIEKRVKRITLSSGIKVALMPKKTRGEAVTGQLVLHFGNEKSLQSNVTSSSLLGSLMMRGTTKHTRAELEDLLDQLKSNLHVSSQAGALSVAFQSKRANLPAVLDVMKEVLREPSFPEKEFDLLKRNQKQSLEKALTDPQSLASRSLSRQLNPYPADDVRYVPSIPESIERLEKTTLEQVVKLYKEQIGVVKGELVLVGDFDSDKIVPQLEAVFSNWKTNVAYERISSKANLSVKGKKETLEIPDKEGAVFVAGEKMPLTDTDPQYAALSMGNYLLGGVSTSRLWDRLRQKEGWSYGAGSRFSADPLDKNSSVLIFAICNPENIDKVDVAALEELKRILAKGITDEELTAGKRTYLEEMKVDRSNDVELAAILRSGLYLGRTFDYYAKLEQKIGALTTNEVNSALTAHVDPERLVIIRAGDFSKKSKE